MNKIRGRPVDEKGVEHDHKYVADAKSLFHILKCDDLDKLLPYPERVNKLIENGKQMKNPEKDYKMNSKTRQAQFVLWCCDFVPGIYL